MHIGLIGGIGPAATDFYSRRLMSRLANKGVPLGLTIVHADTPTLCEAIMLGGTDLAIVFNEAEAPFPLVDCAAIHVDAIASAALA
jgi:aspartate/glutamate racemase